MRRSRFSDEQIIGVPKEADAGAPTAEVCRRARHLASDLISLEGALQRTGAERDPAAAAA